MYAEVPSELSTQIRIFRLGMTTSLSCFQPHAADTKTWTQGWCKVPLVVREVQGGSVALMQSPESVDVILEALFPSLSHTTSESVP